jgi:hypothetical protein
MKKQTVLLVAAGGAAAAFVLYTVGSFINMQPFMACSMFHPFWETDSPYLYGVRSQSA